MAMTCPSSPLPPDLTQGPMSSPLPSPAWTMQSMPQIFFSKKALFADESLLPVTFMTMAVSHMSPGSTSLALTEWMPHVTRFDFPYKIKSKRIAFCLFLFFYNRTSRMTSPCCRHWEPLSSWAMEERSGATQDTSARLQFSYNIT